MKEIVLGAKTGRKRLAVYGAYLLIGALCLFLPPFIPAYAQTMVVKVFIYGIFALSLNLLFGYTGLFSLGHAAFFGVGAYTAAILIIRAGIDNFWLGAGASLLATAFCAACFGIVALKVSSGIYFLLVTLAMGQLLNSVAIKWHSLTGGSNGIVAIPYPKIGLPLNMTPGRFYYLALIFFALCVFLLHRVVNSPFGRILQGIRGDERRMRCLGYNTWLYRYVSIIIGALFAGIAGVLSMYQNGFVGPGNLDVFTSTSVMLMVILGSDRVFWGPVLGAALVVFLEYFASLYTPERWPLILGCAFLLSVTFLRGGVALQMVKVWKRLRNRYGIA